MSVSQYKGKKMTFDEYEKGLGSKQSIAGNKAKGKKVENSKPLTQDSKKVVKTKQQYTQKQFSHVQINSQLHAKYQPDSHTEQSSLAHQNHPNQTSIHSTIPAPISHVPPITHQHHTEPLSAITTKPQEVSKIDLIFQKQPEDVQKKLRMLLLNYNAVMQYNQDEDKFQVDLLLPFNNLEEKEIFVEKFMKTRIYLNGQVEKQKQSRDEKQSNQEKFIKDGSQKLNIQQKQHQDHLISPNQPQSHPNHSSFPEHATTVQKTSHHVPESSIKSPNESYHDGQNVLSTSLREQTQRIQEEKQLQETDHKIDFFTLSQSLDLSIQKGLTLIRQEKLVKMEREMEAQQRSDKGEKTVSKEIEQNEIDKSSHSNIPQPEQPSHLNPHIQSPYKQPPSQIQSQSPCAPVPYTLQRNIHTPSIKKSLQQQSWMKPLQQNESQPQLNNSSLDYSHEENSRMIRPTGSSLYESPIVPMKHDLSYERGNLSNEILIEDLEDQDDEGEFQMDQERQEYSIEQESYSSAFDMIEETAEEHQHQHEHEQEHFPSSHEYKQFLKKKIKDTHGINSHHPTPISQKQHTKIYPKENSSSLRAKYSEFLSKNHKKIESLYLRIGRQMRKRKQQDYQKRKTQVKGEILVAEDNDEDINDREGLLEGYKKRIVMENDSMSSEDKVRYFRYLAKHAKGLYIDFIRSQNTSKRTDS